MTTTAQPTGKQKLRAAVRDMPGASTAELALAAGIGRPTASSLLNKWLTESKVRQEKTGRSVAWFDIDADVTTPEPAAAEQRFTAEDVDAALDQLQAELTAAAPAISAILDAPMPGEQPEQPAAETCKCGGDDTGHVHPPASERAAKKGSVEGARKAALDALGRAGVEGMKVSAVWAVMQNEGGIVWVGAYRLLNRMRRENGVIVTGEHKAEDRTARLAPR